jgi:ribosomal protein S21
MNKKPYQKQEPWQITGAKVQVRNGDVNGALRRLKKILEGADRQKDLSKHEYFEKNSIKKKRARDAAVKRTRKEAMSDIVGMTANKPSGTYWMKSKRKRRRVLDQENALVRHQRKQQKARGQ